MDKQRRRSRRRRRGPIDHRPPVDKRTLKRGKIRRKDGMIFWGYSKSHVGGEAWVTPDKFRERQQKIRERQQKAMASRPPVKKMSLLEKRFSVNVRSRICHALKRNSKASSSEDLLGCSLSELRDYLAGKFTEGMSWGNYGKWHIDHIKPCHSFNLEIESQQRECFHYTNLQPLWATDNFKKGIKIVDTI